MSSLDQFDAQFPLTDSPNGRRSRLRLPSLGLRVSERKVLLAVVDVLLLNLALIAAVSLTTELLPAPAFIVVNQKWFITLTLVWGVTAVIFDVYNLARAASVVASLQAALSATGAMAFVYLAIPFYTPPIQSRSYGFFLFLFSLVAIAVWRTLYARAFIQPTFQRRALVIGAGRSGQALAGALTSDIAQRDANPFTGTGYELVGFVDDDPERLHSTVAEIPVLGNSQHLVALVRRMHVDEIIVSITNAEHIQPALFEALLDCREMGLPITTMTTVYERLTGRVAVAHASRNIEIASGRRDSPFDRANIMFHRLIDFVFAALGGLALLLAIPVVALANRMTAPGPLFYRQQRVGQGGKTFTALKFRSMIPEAETDGAVWARKDDDRVTGLGRLLRSSHIDELPQVLNVLKGDMSIVGPRPERPVFVDQLSKTIPFYRARHSVRPGITGWAQIHQDYGDSVDDAQDKLEYDLYYIKNATPLFDLLIILRTLSKVLGFRGR